MFIWLGCEPSSAYTKRDECGGERGEHNCTIDQVPHWVQCSKGDRDLKTEVKRRNVSFDLNVLKVLAGWKMFISLKVKATFILNIKMKTLKWSFIHWKFSFHFSNFWCFGCLRIDLSFFFGNWGWNDFSCFTFGCFKQGNEKSYSHLIYMVILP